MGEILLETTTPITGETKPTPQEKNIKFLTGLLGIYLPKIKIPEDILLLNKVERRRTITAIAVSINSALRETGYSSLKNITGYTLWETINGGANAQFDPLSRILEEISESRRREFEEAKRNLILKTPETEDSVNPAATIIEALESIEEAATQLGIDPISLAQEAIGIFKKYNSTNWKEKQKKQ